MTDKITITWEADDGYAGGARPQSFTVCPSEYIGLDRSSVREQLEAEIQNDFEQTVSWSCDGIEAHIDQIMLAAIVAADIEADDE